MARAWGCTPDQLRLVTHDEYVAMVDQLMTELAARQRRR